MNHYLWKNSFKLNFDGQEILQDKQEIYNKACRDLQTASALTADEVWEKAGKPLGVAGTEAKGRLQKIDLWLN